MGIFTVLVKTCVIFDQSCFDDMFILLIVKL